ENRRFTFTTCDLQTVTIYSPLRFTPIHPNGGVDVFQIVECGPTRAVRLLDLVGVIEGPIEENVRFHIGEIVEREVGPIFQALPIFDLVAAEDNVHRYLAGG